MFPKKQMLAAAMSLDDTSDKLGGAALESDIQEAKAPFWLAAALASALADALKAAAEASDEPEGQP